MRKMNLLDTIIETEGILIQLGMSFWAKKLNKIKSDFNLKTEKELAQDILKLYGGWGTLNDNAPENEAATKQYFDAINKLHHVAKQYA